MATEKFLYQSESFSPYSNYQDPCRTINIRIRVTFDRTLNEDFRFFYIDLFCPLLIFATQDLYCIKYHIVFNAIYSARTVLA